MEKKSLWFTATTISNYEQKVAKDLSAMKENRNLDEIEKIIVPMEEYTTARGLVKERPKYPSYFYVKIQVDDNNQPSTPIWYIIRNIKGCKGLLNTDGYMSGMTNNEFKEQLNVTDEDIEKMV